jgi:hypothetical protein
MSINEIRERVEESKRLNGVFGPQPQDDIEYLLDLFDRLKEEIALYEKRVAQGDTNAFSTDRCDVIRLHAEAANKKAKGV